MIRYSLKCDRDHRFDSWFPSAAAYDRLQADGLLTCALCGSSKVEKALMAPRIATAEDAPEPTSDAPAPDAEVMPSLRSPQSPQEAQIAALRAKIEAISDDVGRSFAVEARAMHDGEMPHRPIHGEAAPDEARALIEDGVPILPLPFLSKSKAN